MRFISILVMAALFACNSAEEKTTTETGSKTEQTGNSSDGKDENKDNDNAGLGNVTGCYMQVIQRDTFVANLTQDGNKISGDLKFDNYQKDGSSGKVSGSREDNVLKLVYDFQSEGTNSIMDVYFKVDGDKLIRGEGDMETNGNRVTFKDPSKINYSGSTTLKKVDCNRTR